MPKGFDYPDLKTEEPSKVSLGAGQEQSVFTKQRIIANDVARIEPGINFINAWGWIEYSDVFEGTPRHRTEFSAVLAILGGAAGQKQTVWEQTGPFNGADGDCYRQPTT